MPLQGGQAPHDAIVMRKEGTTTPKTRPLTQEQREEAERKRICQDILDRLNEKRGRERKRTKDFARELGISDYTWWRWNTGGIETGEIGNIITALHRAGMTLEVVVKSA